MNRAEALKKLKAYAEAVRAMGATSLYVFGSTARDEAGENSDIDLFIDYDRNSKFSLLDLVDIKLRNLELLWMSRLATVCIRC